MFCISAEVMCKDRDEASRKTKEISADLKKRYGDMVDENGKVLLEVTSDGSCVTVDFRQAPASKPPPQPPAAKATAK